MKQYVPRTGAALLAAGCVATIHAQDPETDALRLADQVPTVEARPGDWRTFVETAVGASEARADGRTRPSRRFSFDLQFDHAWSPQWRAVLSDRLDASWPAQGSGDHGVNTLKEAYAGWRDASSYTMLDLGRINVRNGVAMGYNPTDFLRAGAVRSLVSVNPASLKDNRQGSVMLRAQQLWNSGSLTALVSPALAHDADARGTSLDWGATNARDRGLLTISQNLGDAWTPQILVYQEASQATQLGFNMTGLVNNATVLQFEWSGGRSASQAEQALGNDGPGRPRSWHQRIAAGATYTTPSKLSLTAELHYDGAAPDSADWNALRSAGLPAFARYLSWVQQMQDLPTRKSLFVFTFWQDALVQHLDLSLMLNRNLIDASHRTWGEARYHTGRAELAMQWQQDVGAPWSAFGSTLQSRAWLVSMRLHF